MSDFIGYRIPLKKSLIDKVFETTAIVYTVINKLRSEERKEMEISTSEFVKGSVDCRITTHSIPAVQFFFSLDSGKRNLSVWFDYNDLPEDKLGPNIYLYIGRWGSYDEIFKEIHKALILHFGENMVGPVYE